LAIVFIGTYATTKNIKCVNQKFSVWNINLWHCG